MTVRAARPRRRRDAGYTFIEMLIAMGVMALLLAIGIPRLSRLRAPYVMAGATRQIAADVILARQRAIARNAPYRLNFNVANGTYQLERQVGVAWVADGAVQRLPNGVSLGTITPGNPGFDSRGLAAADVTIPVMVTGATTRTVTINVLGRTTIS
jgi:prepilin-type N-terminal cleavage/methylation domain-containing protein